MLIGQVKFITRPSVHLKYADPEKEPKTICALVIRNCHLPPTTDLEEWWDGIGKRITQSKITTMRNDRIKLFKWEYFGTC